jgi:hypothetical protein
MTKLRGADGFRPNPEIFDATRDAVNKELPVEKAAIAEAIKARRLAEDAAWAAERRDGWSASRAARMEILTQELQRAGSRFGDPARYQKLLQATDRELDEAQSKLKEKGYLPGDLDGFKRLLPDLARLDTRYHANEYYTEEARVEYRLRRQLTKSIEYLLQGLRAAGDSPAVANFPRAQLETLKRGLEDDMKLLVSAKGESITREAGSSYGGYGSSYGSYGSYKPFDLAAEKAQKKVAEMKAPRVSLTTAQVSTLDGAAQSLAKLLKAPELAEALEARGAGLNEEARERFVKLLGAYALLVDEAIATPDYRKSTAKVGGTRSFYRARLHSQPSSRNEASRAALKSSLQRAIAEDAPEAALERALCSGFLHEIGLPEEKTAGWKPTGDAVREALVGEAVAPLRFFNELTPSRVSLAYEWIFPRLQEAFTGVSRAIVEGRLEEWRAGLPTNAEQLAMLSPDGRAAWVAPIATERQVKDKQGQEVTIKTHEARGIERLWVTKGNTGSHGFDYEPSGAPCLLAFLMNARTEAIVAEDPRFPDIHVGRMYMRALRLANGDPVMFVESNTQEQWHDELGKVAATEIEETLLRHAMQKAKAIGAPLVISGYAKETVDRLGLEGTWTPLEFTLSPTALIEASVAFGKHDWVCSQPLTVKLNKVPFLTAPTE